MPARGSVREIDTSVLGLVCRPHCSGKLSRNAPSEQPSHVKTIIRKALTPSKKGFSNMECWAFSKALNGIRKASSLNSVFKDPSFWWKKDSR